MEKITEENYDNIKDGDFLYHPYPYDKETRHDVWFVLVKKNHYCVMINTDNNHTRVWPRPNIIQYLQK